MISSEPTLPDTTVWYYIWHPLVTWDAGTLPRGTLSLAAPLPPSKSPCLVLPTMPLSSLSAEPCFHRPPRGSFLFRCNWTAPPQQALVLLFLLLVLVVPSMADLPVDCRHHDILGNWTFDIGPAMHDKSVVCHHGKGVSVRNILLDFKPYLDQDLGLGCAFTAETRMQVELKEPNVAVANIGDRLVEGTWTMVYNEAFDLQIDGRSYLGFSLFDNKAVYNKRNHCSQTWPGRSFELADPDAKTWACFAAYKTLSHSVCDGGFDEQGQVSGEEKPESFAKPLTPPLATPQFTLPERRLLRAEEKLNEGIAASRTTGVDARLPTEAAKGPFPHPHPHQQLYNTDDDYLARINQRAQGAWVAGFYPELEKMSLAEIQQRIGSIPPRRHHGHSAFEQRDPRAVDSLKWEERGEREDKGARRHLLYRGSKQISPPIDLVALGLPEAFDWRNVNGVNYMDEVVDQVCASCYAATATSQINCRARIATNNTYKANFGYKQILRCDRYNQGCVGGYPYLVLRYALEFGMVERGDDGEPPQCPAGAAPHTDYGVPLSRDGSPGVPRARISTHRYVGGFYGSTTVEDILKEVYSQGPVSVGMTGSLEFLHYKSGVYHPTEASHPSYDFEPVDHAVLVVGWRRSANDGKIHYIIKNTYGANWGEDGYFRIDNLELLGESLATSGLVRVLPPPVTRWGTIAAMLTSMPSVIPMAVVGVGAFLAVVRCCLIKRAKQRRGRVVVAAASNRQGKAVAASLSTDEAMSDTEGTEGINSLSASDDELLS